MAAFFDLIEFLLDPTFLFCVGCVYTPIRMAKRLKEEELYEYLLNPSLVGGAVLVLVCIVIGKVLKRRNMTYLRRCESIQRKNEMLHAYQRVNYTYLMRPLRIGERLRSRWYLLNGLLIHGYLEGMVGYYKKSPLMAANYAKVDRRYAAEVGSYQGSAVHVICLTELFGMAPLCVLLYWAFQVRHSMRDPLELLVCILQGFGTVIYLGQEIISGGRNMDLDYFYTFSMHYLVYFWFGVVFGSLLYIVVPGYLGLQAMKRIGNQIHFYQRHHYTRRSLDHVTPR